MHNEVNPKLSIVIKKRNVLDSGLHPGRGDRPEAESDHDQQDSQRRHPLVRPIQPQPWLQSRLRGLVAEAGRTCLEDGRPRDPGHGELRSPASDTKSLHRSLTSDTDFITSRTRPASSSRTSLQARTTRRGSRSTRQAKYLAENDTIRKRILKK